VGPVGRQPPRPPLSEEAKLVQVGAGESVLVRSISAIAVDT
jgi:hypothetical protein